MMLLCVIGVRCWMMTKDRSTGGLSEGMLAKASKGSRPPAEEPMPTTGKAFLRGEECLLCFISFTGRFFGAGGLFRCRPSFSCWASWRSRFKQGTRDYWGELVSGPPRLRTNKCPGEPSWPDEVGFQLLFSQVSISYLPCISKYCRGHPGREAIEVGRGFADLQPDAGHPGRQSRRADESKFVDYCSYIGRSYLGG